MKRKICEIWHLLFQKKTVISKLFTAKGLVILAIGVFAVLAAAYFTLILPGQLQPEEIYWHNISPDNIDRDVDELLSKAKLENKYVLIYFYGYKYNAYGCKEVERTLFENEEVVAFINKHFISAKLDLDAPGVVAVTVDRYYIEDPPAVAILAPNGSAIARFIGLYTPENFITASKRALGLIKTPLSLENALDQTQMLLSFPETATGWVRPDLYLSPIYEIKPGQTIEDICTYPYPNPERDLTTARLLIRSCEKEGSIKYWVAGEYQGLSFLDEDVALGKTVASCCSMPWTDAPQHRNLQKVTSEDYAGKFQFVLIVLVHKE